MRPRRQGGFTLLEITIVLVIVGFLAAGLLAVLPAQQELRNQAAGERQLTEAREALIGFALANGYLPCPARSGSDGSEDRTAGACTGGRRTGLLPWTALGIPRTDPWGRLLRYSAAPAFTGSASPPTLASSGDILVRSRNDAGALVDISKTSEVVALVWSTGRNGYWGWVPDAISPGTDGPGPNDDEDSNSAPGAMGTLFIFRPPSPADSPSGEFDDLMAWVPRTVLFNRLVAAGRLP